MVILAVSIDSCGLDHTVLIRDLDAYHMAPDPEFCADILDRIYEFNDSCRPTLEIIDCG